MQKRHIFDIDVVSKKKRLQEVLFYYTLSRTMLSENLHTPQSFVLKSSEKAVNTV